MYFGILMLLVSAIHPYKCVEVHFETTDSGFFLKHSRQPPVTPEISNIQSSPEPPIKFRQTYDSVLSIDRFTVVQTTQPVSIRASYGPFSTKQTVPARYIVPDIMENQGEYLNNTTAALLELQQSNVHLDISAHLVRVTIPQDSPVLRVLFHTGADPGGHLQRQKICVLIHVTMGTNLPLKGRCTPEGEDGVCVAEVVIPFSWWPALPLPHKDNYSDTPLKVPQRLVQVSYSVFEPPLRNPEQCEPKVQIQPLTVFAQVPLVPATKAFKEVRADELLTILMPQHPIYPMSKIHVPVFLHQTLAQKVVSFTVKARVKSGIKILGATASSDLWNISVEKENPKHTNARVTAFKKEDDGNLKDEKESTFNGNINRTCEVFSWLLEVADDTKESLDGGKIVWAVSYIYENSKVKDISADNTATDEAKRRLIAKLEINKDDIQAVLPMAKNWELMNTAVLTGRQVAQAMKVFIVSQAGKVADITLQSSCHAEDESVIKVSSSCSSVYVDGSEIRGSSNATVIVKYGIYSGVAKFIVWMPEIPLEVFISDFRLSQIKGWKVLDENHYLHKKQLTKRKKRSYTWGQHGTRFHNNIGADKMICRVRYQQSAIEVYARFLAIDQNSGRMSYFISRRTGLRVTDLVRPLLRIADPKIASLKGRILQGKSMGRTDVQVLSPITGRVIGKKEIRVGSDKVSLTKLVVKVVSGLQLTIAPDSSIENGYIAETSVTHKLTAQYQEGLLDIDLVFSDGSRTPLRDIAVEDYFLLVESLDTEVVAFAPMLASHHPRVIAVGEGNGNLLRVTLLLSEDCRIRRNSLSSKQIKSNTGLLSSALASVEVDFNNIDNINKQESIQNDGIIGRDRKGFRSNGDLGDIIVGVPLRDSNHGYEAAVKQNRGKINSVDKLRHGRKAIKGQITSMEVGMYILLTAFCFAIVVFVISCVVYASKFKPINFHTGFHPLPPSKEKLGTNVVFREPKLLKETTTNAHDWVWLGRSSMDRPSVVTDSTIGAILGSKHDPRLRITSNPILTYSNCDNGHSSIDRQQLVHMNVDNFKNEMQNCINSDTDMTNKTDYRPPVPPHRNIGVRTLVTKVNQTSNTPCNENCLGSGQDYIGKMTDTVILSNENQSMFPKSKKKIDFQQTSPEQIFSPHQINVLEDLTKRNQNELHNAEILVEYSNQQHKSAFQFDSLTPKRIPTGHASHSSAYVPHNKRFKNPPHPNKNSTSPMETGEFITCNCGSFDLKNSRVKRATVVGNPMFSSTAESNMETGDSLCLDDLDMDYEQIMHYFDNLKESNA